MNRLIPMLPVKSMPASIEFYQKLGFSVERGRMIGVGPCSALANVA